MALPDIVDRWAQEVRKDNPKYLRPSNANIIVDEYDDRLYSYGSHFELARWVRATDAHSGFFLLNGDTYSVSTSRHQRYVRAATEATGKPVIIVPYSALRAASIDRDTIVPIEIVPDRVIVTPVTYTEARLPHYVRRQLAHPEYFGVAAVVKNDDGTYTHHQERHVLGESVFTAQYSSWRADGGFSARTRTFLSAFDHQETNLHYFLAQLPDDATPATVEEAFAALQPQEVKAAVAAGLTVTRQGDVFAIPTDVVTRETVDRARMVRVLGLSHVATEVASHATLGTLARGILRHRPAEVWRNPEHRSQKMGDGKTWHLLVKNTVPVDADGNNRAWSVVGNVD